MLVAFCGYCGCFNSGGYGLIFIGLGMLICVII